MVNITMGGKEEGRQTLDKSWLDMGAVKLGEIFFVMQGSEVECSSIMGTDAEEVD
jgi:hypothetical protein